MKKIIILLFTFIFTFLSFGNLTYSQDSSVNGSTIQKNTTSSTSNLKTTTSTSDENILWLTNENLREWNVNIDSIPIMLAKIANTIIFISGMVAIFMLIFFAFKMQINSWITWDSSGVDRAKKWMIWSAVGFVIAVSAWFIMARIIDVLTMLSSSK